MDYIQVAEDKAQEWAFFWLLTQSARAV